MSLSPLLEAPWVIQLHTVCAIAAFLLAIVQLAAPKGTLPHKSVGAIWIALMAGVVISSIFIRPAIVPGLPFLQWFNWIHVFTVITGYALIQGSLLLLRGGPMLKRHSRPFFGAFIGGLVGAGAFAIIVPGRIMYKVLFGG